MYSASFAFFEGLWDAGVTHCFVNLGSDHPGMVEAMVKGQREGKAGFPRIITCPSEMVAMSMADGYARVTGKPQCVIVHVDVGTQALGVAVHNASSGHAPVLIFAGMSPFTQEVKTGVNIKQMVNRALQFSRTAPQGPVYLCAAREVMEAEIKPYSIKQEQWEPVELGGLSSKSASRIAKSLAGSERPLVVTGYSGRNHSIPGALIELADTIKALRWNAPRKSYMLIHADGVAAEATNEEMNISFNPPPDYAGIAAAAGAGDIFALKATKANELEAVLRDAVAKVKAGRTTVVDCKVLTDC
ncbi:thiamine diphosphate-binding protein [Trichoderma citrinoviride]|uniref:Thiamine diphosphate-binding protein n=1 Tax=Trichoderma citrinoviride TaxID=58853 RepID=A0A2T4B2Q0_9HYPO|nr:thiamine diphosphate-binding protein [Trichoderma citrinoviride]PTB63605.1 thiamine diphosphate-binding protein [Trichoderma citrinoviride]